MAATPGVVRPELAEADRLRQAPFDLGPLRVTNPPRRRVWLMVGAAFAAAGLTPQARAQDGRGGRFDDDFISRLEGQWRISRQIRGTTVHNVARATWVLNHQFLQIHMKDVAEPPQYEAIVLIGYVHSDQRYVAHWLDNFGGKYAGVGRGKRQGHSIEFRFDYASGPFFNTFTWNPERDEWQFRGESQAPDGSRQLFALDMLTRQR